MFRTAVVPRKRQEAVAREYSVPAPVGGLNAQDSITDMPVQDALVLDNFFPQPDFVELRRGYVSHATGLSGAVESVMEWAGPSTRKLFGATSSKIFNVSSAGSGTQNVTGLSNARWQHLMTATSGGNFLVTVNGADALHVYDGSSWTVPTINGISSTSFSNLALFKERLWFVERDSSNAWYLDTQAVAGTAHRFPLGAVFKHGGKLVAIGVYTNDGGSGPDDYIVFLSNTGEAAKYQGTDPSSAATWAHAGTFYLPPPIGNRCTTKAGGDLAIITDGGIISFNAASSLDRSAQERAAITSKINRLFMEDSRSYRTNAGWQIITYPRSHMAIVNIPISQSTTQRQYVMNTLTGSWCRFTGINAGCWALFNEDLYFGGNDGEVCKANTSFQDDGGGITADLKTAFSALPAKGRLKAYKMLRALFSSNGSPGYLMDLNIDYEDRAPTSTPTPGTQPSSVWDLAQWDVDLWASGETITQGWVGAAGVGTTAAIRLRVVSNGASCTVNGFDVVAEIGGAM